jgi:hypothetical protein
MPFSAQSVDADGSSTEGCDLQYRLLRQRSEEVDHLVLIGVVMKAAASVNTAKPLATNVR